MADQEKPPKGEVDNCRHRLLKYCRGQGLDLGMGVTKIKPDAIGIDLYSPYADMHEDARILKNYPDDYFDFVFSSHLLEELQNTEATLREWIRVLKPGGNLVLYQADKDVYYPLGHPQCNKRHIHHFGWEDLWSIFQSIGGMSLVHHDKFNLHPYNEWSFELVVRKGTLSEPEIPMEGISLLIPTLNRPKNLEDFTMSVEQTAKVHDQIEILYGIHADDIVSKTKIEELKGRVKISVRAEIIDRHPDGVHLSFLWNQIYPRAKFPILGYFGDDVIFRTPGWDEEVRKEFAADKRLLVCCNDCYQHGSQATLYFTHKIVHDAFGFYLPMKFRRWFMDTFLDRVFRHSGKFRYREDIVTEHMHPERFPERTDDVYRAMNHHKQADQALWESPENIKDIEKYIQILKAIP